MPLTPNRRRSTRVLAAGAAFTLMTTLGIVAATNANAGIPAEGTSGPTKTHNVTCYVYGDKLTKTKTLSPMTSVDIPSEYSNIFYDGKSLILRMGVVPQDKPEKLPTSWRYDKLKVKVVVKRSSVWYDCNF
jgi:hypothetical protein